jgi:hypothetical protein
MHAVDAAQDAWHRPSAQSSPAAHAQLHMPQCARSTFTLRQLATPSTTHLVPDAQALG